MHRPKIASLLVLLVLFSGNAYADGNELLKNCQDIVALERGQNVTNPVGAGHCGGYLEGFATINRFYGHAQENTFFCLPDGVRVGQTVRVVVKYLQNHPEELHESEGMLVLRALNDAFPCSN